jgi:NADH-quinone oxidoreductase subunit J
VGDERISFLFFSAVALTGAVNVVVRRNPVHAALWLVGAFLGVAGIFLTLGAGLLGAIQVIVYAGAIMVLFLFVILLLNLETTPFEGLSIARGASLLAAVATLALILLAIERAGELRAPFGPPKLDLPPTASNVASALLTRYALPFELISLLLLVAMVAAIHVAHRPGSRAAGAGPGSRAAGAGPGSRAAGAGPGSRAAGAGPGSRAAGAGPRPGEPE